MRVFTLAEANALLPQVEGMMRDLQEQHRRLSEMRRDYANAVQRTSSNGHTVEEKLRGQRQQIETAAESLNAAVQAVQELGCVVKDLAMGLVDFPGERDGQVVNLCWRLGEPE